MQQFTRFSFMIVLTVFVAVFSFSSLLAAGAPQQEAAAKAKLKVNINIDQDNIFWNYTFLTKDSDLGKPANVKLSWSLGDRPGKEQSEIIVTAGKASGQTTIVTDKGELVNLNIGVYDNKNVKLGFISMQVKNNGQSESINITPPEFTEPKITWGNY